MESDNQQSVLFGNGLTLEELTQIEEAAHRSGSPEAVIILRISAALRDALQFRENALALVATIKHSSQKRQRNLITPSFSQIHSDLP